VGKRVVGVPTTVLRCKRGCVTVFSLVRFVEVIHRLHRGFIIRERPEELPLLDILFPHDLISYIYSMSILFPSFALLEIASKTV